MKIALFGSSKPEACDRILCILSTIPNVEIVDTDNISPDVDMALSIGGDGTFLRTVHAVGQYNIPILGINAGHLGFLSDIGLEEVEEALPAIFKGHYIVEQRSLLHLQIPECKQPYQADSLNEVAILKRDQSSMVNVAVWVDGEFLNQYDADGLVVATPTGSTAYAMSAGGPILEPQSNCFLIVPIAPHSLTSRPLVIRDSAVLDIEVSSRNELYLVATDGKPLHLTTQYRLQLSKSDHQVQVVRRPESSFYKTLRQKLMWGLQTQKRSDV